ncbi:hypothetical protein CLOM621_05956 [Clostridium sp. M62/1]|nr:hypothetical protein CLOM621_05956 [Clostridium sp. M62/1]
MYFRFEENILSIIAEKTEVCQQKEALAAAALTKPVVRFLGCMV